MLRRWVLAVPCVALLAFGCSRPAAPALQTGDVVRPEISFAPNAPWPADAKVSVGVLLRGERPGVESYYLKDEDVVIERAVMGARITFLNGEQIVGDPLDVALIHDC